MIRSNVKYLIRFINVRTQPRDTHARNNYDVLVRVTWGRKPWRCVGLDSRHQLALRGEEVRNLILGSLRLLV